MLTTADAAAAILRLDDGRYVMQLRDSKPGIWYPGHWGCFGGAIDAGETAEQAVRRELLEELELVPPDLKKVAHFDFGLDPLGFKSCCRVYFLVRLPASRLASLVLHEGAAVEAIEYARLMGGMPVTPYDAFAIRLLRLSETGT
jgi:8-oxo-dGTP pyrophosphatase MutT (NUDIX family)